MDETDRPPLVPYVWEVIAKSLHELDKAHWSVLSELRVPYPTGTETGFSPSPPKLPEHLRNAVCLYARERFNREADEYPVDPKIEFWLSKLQERVVERIIKAVKHIDSPGIIGRWLGMEGKYGLSWHGLSEDDIRRSMNETLDELRAKTLARYQAALARPIDEPPVDSQADDLPESDEKNPTEPRASSVDVVEYRKKLLADYKAATGNPPDQQIYEARNCPIHKPQFYKWRNGKLAEKSRMTQAFEQFLKAKRRPIPKS